MAKRSTVQDVDWPKLLQRPEFVGHNTYSLQNLFAAVSQNTAKRLGCSTAEVKMSDIVKYVGEKSGPKNVNMKVAIEGKRCLRKFETIKFFESLIS